MEDRYENTTANLLAEEQVEGEQVEETRPRSGLLQRVTYFGVVLFCAVYFFRPEDFWLALAPIPIAKIAGIFTGVALLFAVLIEKAELPEEGKILLGLLAYLSVCIPFSYWPGGSVEVVLQVFAKTIVIAIAAMVSITSGKQLLVALVPPSAASMRPMAGPNTRSRSADASGSRRPQRRPTASSRRRRARCSSRTNISSK